jgi:ABC-2 type transport system permease protein
MIVFIVLMVSEFSAYYDNPEMADILDNMPDALLNAFSLESANLTTASGFISIAAIYIYLILGMYSAILGSNILSKEERDKTAEFFMTLPVSREQVIRSKLITSVINCALINVITSIAIIGTMLPYDLDKEFFKFTFLMMFAVFIIQMIFVTLGFFLASILKRYKTSGKIATAIVMVLYIVNVLSGLHKNLAFLEYFSPYRYFSPIAILNDMAYEAKFVAISIVCIVLFTAGTFLIYPKRDLHL